MTAPEHDPATCATCSGRRHRPEPNPLADRGWDFLESLDGDPTDSQPVPPVPNDPPSCF